MKGKKEGTGNEWKREGKEGEKERRITNDDGSVERYTYYDGMKKQRKKRGRDGKVGRKEDTSKEGQSKKNR